MAINGDVLESAVDIRAFASKISAHPPGAALQLTYLRGEQTVVQELALGTRPAIHSNPRDPAHHEVLEAAEREFAQWCAELIRVGD